MLPKTQSRIFAFIIRESQLYLSFAEHKTRRKLRFAQSQFRRPALFLSPSAPAELLLKKHTVAFTMDPTGLAFSCKLELVIGTLCH